MIQALQERAIQVDKVQLHWIVQEEPHYTFVPAVSNDEGQDCVGTQFLLADM